MNEKLRELLEKLLILTKEYQGELAQAQKEGNKIPLFHQKKFKAVQVAYKQPIQAH